MEISGGGRNVQDFGISGVTRQSVSMLCMRAKLFAALAFSRILPLCFLGLAHFLSPDPLFSPTAYVGFLLAACVLLVFVIPLLSTATTIFSAACIITKRPLTFRKLLSVLFNVWHNVLTTFLCAFVFVFLVVYCFLFIFTSVLFWKHIAADMLLCMISCVSAAALFHLTCISNLAIVISVLEDVNCIRAFKWSTELIKGKHIVVYCLSAYYIIFISAIIFCFRSTFFGLPMDVALRILIVVVFAVLLAFVDQLGIILFTILYFRCKAYHQENINGSAPPEHLRPYAPEFII